MSDSLLSAARAVVEPEPIIVDDEHTAVSTAALFKLTLATAKETSERRARHVARGVEQERRAQWAHAQRVLSVAASVNDWLADEGMETARDTVMAELDVKCAQALYALLDSEEARAVVRETFFPDMSAP